MTIATLERVTTTPDLSLEDIQSFLYAEARALDDRDWDAWLGFYHKDCPFWMPAWDDEDQLTEDPANEMSLMYYPNRQGIEDRVFRIKTDRSSATSLPEPRTAHNVSNVEVLAREGTAIRLRFNWLTLSYRYGQTDQHWGSSFYTIDTRDGRPLITSKKVILKNDRIHHVIDVYHI